MDANFLCPFCRSYLNVGQKIVVTAKRRSGELGILLLSLHLGDYDVVKHKSFDVVDGEEIKFLCPSCHKSLKAHEIHKNINRIIMQDEEDQEHEILFSGIYGERCTYKVRENVVESFGEHAAKYIDFANLMKIRY